MKLVSTIERHLFYTMSINGSGMEEMLTEKGKMIYLKSFEMVQ